MNNGVNILESILNDYTYESEWREWDNEWEEGPWDKESWSNDWQDSH